MSERFWQVTYEGYDAHPVFRDPDGKEWSDAGLMDHIDTVEALNADLVLVVEKLLAGARGHYTSCSVWRGKKRTPCTCGADEARELLLKIRGEG